MTFAQVLAVPTVIASVYVLGTIPLFYRDFKKAQAVRDLVAMKDEFTGLTWTIFIGPTLLALSIWLVWP